MPKIQINSADLSDIDRPTCGICDSRMWLSRVSITAEGPEWRTFECPVCELSTGAKGDGGRNDSDASTPA